MEESASELSCYICLPYLEEDEKFLSELEEVFDRIDIAEGSRPDKEELRRAFGEYDALVCGASECFDKEVADQVDELEVLASLSRGLDHIDTKAFRRKNVEVVSVEDANTDSVAEHTLALILSLEKKIIESHKAVKSGAGREGLDERTDELKGKTLGIIGAGPIAYEVAERAEAFDLNVKVWTFNPDKHDEFNRLEAEFVEDLSELIRQSSIVSIHIKLSEKTETLLNPELLESISTDKHRVLINTSRAGIVDPEILDNLGDNKVFNAAALDVYPESLPSKSGNRIYYTPHTAGITQESTRRMREEIASKLAQLFSE